MAQPDVSQERVEKNTVVMTVAALATLVGFVLPWFRFETSLALDMDPEARLAFERDFAPTGPLTVFTRFPLNTGARVIVALFLATLVMILVAALIAWRRGGPLWPVRIAVTLSPVLLLFVIGTWLIVGAGAAISWAYAQTVPLVGWWLTLLGLVVVFFSGLNVLKTASLAESAQ